MTEGAIEGVKKRYRQYEEWVKDRSDWTKADDSAEDVPYLLKTIEHLEEDKRILEEEVALQAEKHAIDDKIRELEIKKDSIRAIRSGW